MAYPVRAQPTWYASRRALYAWQDFTKSREPESLPRHKPCHFSKDHRHKNRHLKLHFGCEDILQQHTRNNLYSHFKTSRLAFLLEVLRLPAFASKCGTSTEAWSSTCWVCSWSSTRSTAFFEVPWKRNCERKEWNFKGWKARQHTETTTGRDGGIRHQRCTPLLASNLVESPSIDFSSSWCCQTPENPPVLPRKGPNAGRLDLRPDILTPEVRPNIPCVAPRTQPKGANHKSSSYEVPSTQTELHQNIQEHKKIRQYVQYDTNFDLFWLPWYVIPTSKFPLGRSARLGIGKSGTSAALQRHALKAWNSPASFF